MEKDNIKFTLRAYSYFFALPLDYLKSLHCKSWGGAGDTLTPYPGATVIPYLDAHGKEQGMERVIYDICDKDAQFSEINEDARGKGQMQCYVNGAAWLEVNMWHKDFHTDARRKVPECYEKKGYKFYSRFYFNETKRLFFPHCYYGEWKIDTFTNDYIFLANNEPQAQMLWLAGFQAIYIPRELQYTWQLFYEFNLERFKNIYFYGEAQGMELEGSTFASKVIYVPRLDKLELRFALERDLGGFRGNIAQFTRYVKRAVSTSGFLAVGYVPNDSDFVESIEDDF